MQLAALPDRRASNDPHGPAVADGSHLLTNEQLLRRVRAASRHLRDLDVGLGDVVALQLVDRVELVVLLFSAWRIGATVTPVDPSLSVVEVALQLDDSGARLLVAEDASESGHDLPTLGVGSLRQDLDWEDCPLAVDGSDLALRAYTSEPTGVPQGVMLDHDDLDAMVQMGRRALDVAPDDRSSLILPLINVDGIVVSVLAPLVAGASVVIAPRFTRRTSSIGSRTTLLRRCRRSTSMTLDWHERDG